MAQDDETGGPDRLWKNRYLIEGELGRGGFGVVYLARDKQLRSKRVVIKVLQNESNLDPYFQKKFQQEIEALARIDHPGVVGVLDVGETPDAKPFLVMQYVEGVTLRTEIGEDGMGFRRVSNIIRQISNALGAAHDKGVYHRDLKPANIMLCRSSEAEEYVKLIDFGIAAVMDSEVIARGEPSKVVGTISYMAPEQALGRGGHASDIYALGVIAFEMLTGKRPNVTPNGVTVKPRELRPSIPEEAEKLILRALSYLPESRPASPRQFGDEFSRAMGSETTVAPLPTMRTTVVESSSTRDLEIAYVLFMDIVAYSKLPMDVQSQRVRQLQHIVRSTAEFTKAQQADEIVSLPTGDGMALVFFRNPVAPVQCAIELSGQLKSSYPDIQLRMGIHGGPVYRIADINTNRNVAGEGINVAQRVMDCGDASHILLSKAIADVLRQLSDWAPMLHDLGEVEVKHGVTIHVVNFFTADVGNPELPSKLRKGKIPHALPQGRFGQMGGRAVGRRGVTLSVIGVVLLLVLSLAIGYWQSRQPVASQQVSTTAAPEPSLPPSRPAAIETPTGRMILIPEGQYFSGPDKRSATLPAFYIDETEVTNEAFGRFCSETKREIPACVPGARADFPVVNITIDQAREFARWAGKRLPTLAEWEKAARGAEGREYPWGNDSQFTGANVASASSSDHARSLASVGGFPAADSPWGIRQMAGNVWELIDELRSPSANAVDLFRKNSGLAPAPTSTEAWYLIMGGSYTDPAQPAYEFGHVPARFHSDRIGFRCVRDAR